MKFSNNGRYMVKILPFYIIMKPIFTISLKGLLTLVLKLQDLNYKWYLRGLEIKKQPWTTRAIEQIFILSPVNQNIFDFNNRNYNN